MIGFDDFIKALTEMFWGEDTLEMGFVKFVITFVVLFVGIKAIVYFVEK